MSSRNQQSGGRKSRPLLKRRLALFLAVMQVLGVLTAIDAVMSTRTDQGAVAWAIGLVAAPVVAVPAYWVFGRSRFEGYVEARRQNEGEFYQIKERITDNMDGSVVQFQSRAPAWDALTGLSDTRLLRGNDVQLLIDGEETFDSIIEGILSAREYVLVQFYIVRSDSLGQRLANAMIDRAQAGLEVVFLYDEIGSSGLDEAYLERLQRAGVRVSAFNTTQGLRNKFQLNFRNHRKIVVVDGTTAWIGGHNVGDEYLGLDPELSPWRDTHVRLDGPVVIQAQGVIASDWFWAQRELLEDLNWTPVTVDEADVKAICVPTGPADPLETAGMFFVHALNTARDRIWITAPYFVPDEAVVKALMLASLRGVEVRILLPGLSDSLPTYLAAFHFVELLADSNVQFYQYERGFLHQKVMLVDDHTASVGTHNFDNRSFRLNFEIAAVVYDEGFAREVQTMLEADFANARRIDPASLADRPWYWRLGVKLSRLLSPIL
ncbi:MAG: cardiolipin synthase [Gammaproteobacteria bacterium]|jgi:cardiolipin synthase A/B